jgi:hypothetical protein
MHAFASTRARKRWTVRPSFHHLGIYIQSSFEGRWRAKAAKPSSIKTGAYAMILSV